MLHMTNSKPLRVHVVCVIIFFFFNDTATTEIYTLSLHDALPIFGGRGRTRTALVQGRQVASQRQSRGPQSQLGWDTEGDRKSTRLNSSHLVISYAVFCLKKKNIRHTLLDLSRLAQSSLHHYAFLH